ncbi:hypothetical protein YC2023_041231 [Brassica napus]
MESCAKKDYFDLFNTVRKKCELYLIFTRVILLVGGLVGLLEVESTIGHKLFFVITFPQCKVHSFFSSVIIVTWEVEESEFVYTLFDHKPCVFLPYVFTTVLREFVYVVGLHWRPYQEQLRFMCIITLGSLSDVRDSLTAEVSRFVKHMWLSRYGAFTYTIGAVFQPHWEYLCLAKANACCCVVLVTSCF